MTDGSYSVDVVVPHHDDEVGLRRVLTALAAQEGVPGPMRVVVADDGSPTPPAVPGDVTLVRQGRAGFRASAARHLGAAAGVGDVLLFLDGDTVPEPGYVSAMCRAVGGRNGDIVAVGRRRHARFGPDPDAPFRGLERLPDPRWPGDYYADTDGLADGSDGTWRGVISAVLGVSRELYELAGGFDPAFVGYGGEDWDLAWRCVLAGGRTRHVPDAVAWHDGPAWEGRVEEDTGGGRWAEKNAESIRLARAVASPLVRPTGVTFAVPAVGVDLRISADWPEGTAVATCTALLGCGDVGVRVSGPPALVEQCLDLAGDDPRLRPAGAGGTDPLSWWATEGPRRGPELVLTVGAPCRPDGAALDGIRRTVLREGEVTLVVEGPDGVVECGAARSAHHLARREYRGEAAPGTAPRVRVAGLDGPVRLERCFGGW